MKTLFSKKTCLMICLFMAGIGSVWAQDELQSHRVVAVAADRIVRYQ